MSESLPRDKGIHRTNTALGSDGHGIGSEQPLIVTDFPESPIAKLIVTLGARTVAQLSLSLSTCKPRDLQHCGQRRSDKSETPSTPRTRSMQK